MANRVAQGQLIIQNENFHVHQKKVTQGRKALSSKTTMKKHGAGLGNRKALNDITNKSCLPNDTSSKKKISPKEFHIAGEMFLHDHRKCIEEQHKANNDFHLDLVIPGYESMSNVEYPKSKEEKTDTESPYYYNTLEEVPMTEFSDLMYPSTRWSSPPCSPLRIDSPLSSSPMAWKFETIEFTLKEEVDVRNFDF